MYGYVGLYTAMYGHVRLCRLCRLMYGYVGFIGLGYVWVCRVMYGYVGPRGVVYTYVERCMYYWHVVHLKWTAVIILKGRSHSCK